MKYKLSPETIAGIERDTGRSYEDVIYSNDVEDCHVVAKSAHAQKKAERDEKRLRMEQNKINAALLTLEYEKEMEELNHMTYWGVFKKKRVHILYLWMLLPLPAMRILEMIRKRSWNMDELSTALGATFMLFVVGMIIYSVMYTILKILVVKKL